MLYKIITVCFDGSKKFFDDESFQKFIINKKIHSVKSEFFCLNEDAYWTLFLEYEEIIKPVKIDVVKNEPDRIFLQRLKEWRKNEADKAGVPIFIVSTNEELIKIVENKPVTMEGLKNIRGFGKKKIERYGKEITQMVKDYYGI